LLDTSNSSLVAPKAASETVKNTISCQLDYRTLTFELYRTAFTAPSFLMSNGWRIEP